MIRVAVRRASRGDTLLSAICRPAITACNQNKALLQEDRRVAVGPTLSSVVQSKYFHTGYPSTGWFSPKDDVTFLGRTLARLGFTEIPKSILKRMGYLIYMKVADEIDYLKFFEQCNLPDTYASWFTVVELHVWLLSARLMQNGKEGRIVRNSLINALWDDNDKKSRKLEGALPAARRRDMQRLTEQFHAAIISYDEGLLGDDHTLAGALWRRLLRFDSDSPLLQTSHFNGGAHATLERQAKTLEMLVLYVRSQYYQLNNLSKEQLLKKRVIKWAPFDESLYQLASKMEKSSSSSNIKAKMNL